MGVEALTGIGLALSAAGTAAGMKAAASSRRAANNQVKASLAQQEDFKRAANPFYQASLEGSSSGANARDIAEGAAKAKSNYEAAARIPSSTSALPTDAVTERAIDTQRNTSAQTQGYQEAAVRNLLRNINTGTNLGTISNLSNASAATAPILTQLATQKGANLAGIGSLLSTTGNLAGIYGGINAKKDPRVFSV